MRLSVQNDKLNKQLVGQESRASSTLTTKFNHLHSRIQTLESELQQAQLSKASTEQHLSLTIESLKKVKCPTFDRRMLRRSLN